MSVEQLITKHLDIWTSARKTRSSAGRGSSNKLDLYGIKKLRELILELAVRGKLVPQDPNDESATELFKKIQAAKLVLEKQGKIKKQKLLDPVVKFEEFFEVPHGWTWGRLNDVYDVRDGTHDTPRYFEAGYPLVTSKNLSSGVLDLSDVKFISEDDHKKISERSKVDRYDVLFAMIGSIGNPVIVDTDLEFSIKNVALFKYYEIKLSEPNFLLLFLKFAAVRMRETASGAVQSFVSLGTVRNFAFALPPLLEQRRIVAKVDEFMAFCDLLEQAETDNVAAHAQLVEAILTTLTNSKDHQELQTNWQRITEHFDTLFTTEDSIDQLKQTILQLAVKGKLVPQDPNDEPASELLKMIASEKLQLIQEGKIKKEKPLKEIAEEEKPFELPMGWEWVRVDGVCDVQGGIQKQPMRAPKNNHFPYLRVANVQRGYVDTNEMERFELFDGELEKRALNKGDILIVEGNGSADEIGRCAIWSGQIENCVFQNHLIRVRSLHCGNEIFISKFLNSISGIAEMKKLAVTTSGLYNLSVGKIRAIVIPLPPILEQHRIVTKVDELMTLCDTIKNDLQNAQITQLKLVDALVEQVVC